MKIALTVAIAALSGVLTQAATHEFDIVIYGSSPAMRPLEPGPGNLMT